MMNSAQLHLVVEGGSPVSPEIEAAVKRAFHWVSRDYPNVDSALIANWAEDVGRSMEERSDTIQSPQRYAYAALKGKVRDWSKRGAAKEEVSGIGFDLERLGGISVSFQGSSDRKILFEQLSAVLNERDRYILVLLLQDQTSPAAVAKALGTNYQAAAKAIQRVKDRIANTLNVSRKVDGTGHGSPQLCETKG
jgi:DNA-directed RNA polymerase specialized sigma24 family protein